MFQELGMDVMYDVKISNTMKNKCYFWYLYRCLKILEKDGTIELTTFPYKTIQACKINNIYFFDHVIFLEKEN